MHMVRIILRVCAEKPQLDMTYQRRANMVRERIIDELDQSGLPVPGDLWNNAATSRRQATAEHRRVTELLQAASTISRCDVYERSN